MSLHENYTVCIYITYIHNLSPDFYIWIFYILFNWFIADNAFNYQVYKTENLTTLCICLWSYFIDSVNLNVKRFASVSAVVADDPQC